MPRMEVKTLTLLVGISFLMIYLCYAIFGMTEHDAGMMYSGIALGMVPHAFIGAPVHILYGRAMRKYFEKSQFNGPHLPNKTVAMVQFEKTEKLLADVSGSELMYTRRDMFVYSLSCAALSRVCYELGHSHLSIWILAGGLITVFTMSVVNSANYAK